MSNINNNFVSLFRQLASASDQPSYNQLIRQLPASTSISQWLRNNQSALFPANIDQIREIKKKVVLFDALPPDTLKFIIEEIDEVYGVLKSQPRHHPTEEKEREVKEQEESSTFVDILKILEENWLDPSRLNQEEMKQELRLLENVFGCPFIKRVCDFFTNHPNKTLLPHLYNYFIRGYRPSEDQMEYDATQQAETCLALMANIKSGEEAEQLNDSVKTSVSGSSILVACSQRCFISATKLVGQDNIPKLIEFYSALNKLPGDLESKADLLDALMLCNGSLEPTDRSVEPFDIIKFLDGLHGDFTCANVSTFLRKLCDKQQGLDCDHFNFFYWPLQACLFFRLNMSFNQYLEVYEKIIPTLRTMKNPRVDKIFTEYLFEKALRKDGIEVKEEITYFLLRFLKGLDQPVNPDEDNSWDEDNPKFDLCAFIHQIEQIGESNRERFYTLAEPFIACFTEVDTRLEILFCLSNNPSIDLTRLSDVQPLVRPLLKLIAENEEGVNPKSSSVEAYLFPDFLVDLLSVKKERFDVLKASFSKLSTPEAKALCLYKGIHSMPEELLNHLDRQFEVGFVRLLPSLFEKLKVFCPSERALPLKNIITFLGRAGILLDSDYMHICALNEDEFFTCLQLTCEQLAVSHTLVQAACTLLVLTCLPKDDRARLTSQAVTLGCMGDISTFYELKTRPQLAAWVLPHLVQFDVAPRALDGQVPRRAEIISECLKQMLRSKISQAHDIEKFFNQPCIRSSLQQNLPLKDVIVSQLVPACFKENPQMMQSMHHLVANALESREEIGPTGFTFPPIDEKIFENALKYAAGLKNSWMDLFGIFYYTKLGEERHFYIDYVEGYRVKFRGDPSAKEEFNVILTLQHILLMPQEYRKSILTWLRPSIEKYPLSHFKSALQFFTSTRIHSKPSLVRLLEILSTHPTPALFLGFLDLFEDSILKKISEKLRALSPEQLNQPIPSVLNMLYQQDSDFLRKVPLEIHASIQPTKLADMQALRNKASRILKKYREFLPWSPSLFEDLQCTYVYSSADQLERSNNCFNTYFRLKGVAMQATPSIPMPQSMVAGLNVQLNQQALENIQHLVRIYGQQLPQVDFSQVVPLFDAIKERMQNNPRTKAAVEAILEEATYNELSQEYESGSYFDRVKNYRPVEGQVVPKDIAQAFAVFHFILAGSNERAENAGLSQREERLLLMTESTRGCNQGKTGGLPTAYNLLPSEFKYPDVTTMQSSEKERADEYIYNRWQELLEEVFRNDQFLKEATNIPNRVQDIHQILYLKNVLAHRVGLDHTLTFDWATSLLYPGLLTKSLEELLTLFMAQISPEVVVKKLQSYFKRDHQQEKNTLYGDLDFLLKTRVPDDSQRATGWIVKKERAASSAEESKEEEEEEFGLSQKAAVELWLAAGFLKLLP